jgi:hypothetical protein
MTKKGQPVYTCDECGGGNGLCYRDCPQQRRWEAVRPKGCPCCGGSTVRIGYTCLSGGEAVMKGCDADEAWLRDHPNEQERVRPLSAAEQLLLFLTNGMPHTEVVAYRSVGHTGWATF